jgi:Xaa-Pro dipeptidase
MKDPTLDIRYSARKTIRRIQGKKSINQIHGVKKGNRYSLATLPERRTSRIFQQIDKDEKITVKPDLILVANAGEPHTDYSFFYITGFPQGLFEGSALLARRDGEVSVFTSPLEEAIAKAYGKGIEIYSSRDKQKEDIKRVAGRKTKTVGLNYPDLTVSLFRGFQSIFKEAKFVNVAEPITNARAIKDQIEIEAIEKACNIASRAYEKIPPLLKDGMTESEIAAQLAYDMQRAGGSGVSFQSLVSFGKNSAMPHYSAGQAKLRKGQFVLMDYGTKYMRYCSDITRTLVYGRASSEQKRIYQIVKEANEIGIENCKPTMTGAQVQLKAAEVINSTEYRGRFIHSLGHSLGLAVHDPGPGLSVKIKTKLEPGMVLTVEPGIYIPSLGGVRIEDDVLITKNEPRILTSAPRELIEA